MFIQSLKFEGLNDVHMTGYIWQQYEGEHCDYEPGATIPVRVPTVNVPAEPVLPPGSDGQGSGGPAAVGSCDPNDVSDTDEGTAPVPESTPRPQLQDGERIIEIVPGVVLPEQVDARNPPTLIYTAFNADRGTTAIGWYFEAVVRQPFDFDDFPFDHKRVWLTVWPAEFSANVALVPDFDAYPCPGMTDVSCTAEIHEFGFNEQIVLNDFSQEGTYFNYFLAHEYNSNLGVESFQRSSYPELRFNVVIRRTVANALLSNLVPVLVAAGITFAMLMTISSDDVHAARFGFSTSQTLTTLAVTFLATLLAHQQLRDQFEGVVYLEYLYFVLYVMLLGVAAIATMATAPSTRNRIVFRFGDNLLPQVTFWPVMLGSIAALTVWQL